jgi:hypothetical protein
MSTAASIKLFKKTLILLPQHIYCAMNSTIIRPQAQQNFINRKHNILVCKLPPISSQLVYCELLHYLLVGVYVISYLLESQETRKTKELMFCR